MPRPEPLFRQMTEYRPSLSSIPTAFTYRSRPKTGAERGCRRPLDGLAGIVYENLDGLKAGDPVHSPSVSNTVPPPTRRSPNSFVLLSPPGPRRTVKHALQQRRVPFYTTDRKRQNGHASDESRVIELVEGNRCVPGTRCAHGSALGEVWLAGKAPGSRPSRFRHCRRWRNRQVDPISEVSRLRSCGSDRAGSCARSHARANQAISVVCRRT